MQQGSLSLLCRLISRRFNISLKHARSMLAELDQVDIEELGERLFDADSLAQLQLWVDEKRGQT